MCEAPAAKKARLEQPGVLGEEAISFHVSNPDLGSEETEFPPLMTHQILGDEELIFGYQNPKITVDLNLAGYHYDVHFEHEAKLPGKCTEIKKLIADSLCANAAGSSNQQEEETLRDDTEHLGQAVLGISECQDTKIYHTKLSKAHKALKAVHDRVQLLLPYFIDGANGIDSDDEGWELFTAVKTIAGSCCIVGICTVYRVYAYADSSRLRVSQLFVLPPFQRQGIGRGLLEAVYQAADNENAQDVIYEDPTEDVELMREKIELGHSRKCEWLMKLAQEQHQAVLQVNGHAADQPPASLALPTESVKRAQKDLHITKQQVRKLWEVLLAEQEAFQKEPAALMLRGLIARRLLGKFSDTERQAVGKQIINVENEWGESYIMHKMPVSAGLKGVPVALDEKQEKGQSKEEREQAWEEAIEARWQTIQTLAAPA